VLVLFRSLQNSVILSVIVIVRAGVKSTKVVCGVCRHVCGVKSPGRVKSSNCEGGPDMYVV